ncbi:hypothetical protein P7K49_007440 [Saguinus oedipus]|uniref:Uncharacterized protein n=1 Tax=Saguinus oedipus TaxID=9490 RepID=A0ABQ9VUV8_SAGOE|nr:hypothetical protein P7K49_007440 [Saguinus oedipus]
MREIVHIQAGQCGNQIGAKGPGLGTEGAGVGSLGGSGLAVWRGRLHDLPGCPQPP